MVYLYSRGETIVRFDIFAERIKISWEERRGFLFNQRSMPWKNVKIQRLESFGGRA